MRADAGLHADSTRRQIGESGLHLATRPLLPQHDGTALILADDVERVLADIDADYGGQSSFCDMVCSLSSVPPASIRCWQGGSTAGPFHYRKWSGNGGAGAVTVFRQPVRCSG